jgi:hypothetical protein
MPGNSRQFPELQQRSTYLVHWEISPDHEEKYNTTSPGTQYVVRTMLELGELPHVEKFNFISPKFCTSGQCPILRDRVTRGAMSHNFGQPPRFQDKITRDTMSCNLGQCPRL